MANRPTITDVAREAGVSVATVDRVLNRRGVVREATSIKVAEAAHKVGYHAARVFDDRLRPDLPIIRYGFALHKEKQGFYQDFGEKLTYQVENESGVRGSVNLVYSEGQSPSDFAETLLSLRGKVDVVAATAPNYPAVSEAVRLLAEDNIPTIALLSDFAQGERSGYMGLNNLRIGRTAAWMLGTAAAKGKIALFVGGSRWHGHEIRETGFRSYFRETRPGFELLDTLVNLETRQLTYEATLDLLDRNPDVTGIYVAGGGMEGAITALRESRKPEEVVLIVNELIPESRAALADYYVQMVIQTPLDELCARLVSQMTSAVRLGVEIPGQLFLEPRIWLPESV